MCIGAGDGFPAIIISPLVGRVEEALASTVRASSIGTLMCPYCNRPLLKIDHYGEMLVGCIDCNRWGHPGDDKLIMELMESDLEALRGMRGESG
jgi:hypothetical protein